MARVGIQYADVKHTVIQLLAQGIAPSVQKIRDKLGTGSNTTIAEHLQTWREEYASQTIHHLPANMPPELISAIEVLWQTAMEQANQKLSAIKQELTEQQTKLNQEKLIQEQKILALQASFDQAQKTAESKSTQIQALETELAVSKERLATQATETTALKTQQENRLKQVYDEKHNVMEQAEKYHVEIQQLQQKLHIQAEKQQEAIKYERERQEQSENRWLHLIDQARTESTNLRKMHEASNTKQHQQLDALKELLAELKNKHANSDLACKQSEKLNKDLNQQLNKLQKQYQAALEKMSSLKSQLKLTPKEKKPSRK